MPKRKSTTNPSDQTAHLYAGLNPEQITDASHALWLDWQIRLIEALIAALPPETVIAALPDLPDNAAAPDMLEALEYLRNENIENWISDEMQARIRAISDAGGYTLPVRPAEALRLAGATPN
jgi:hypothetical protein